MKNYFCKSLFKSITLVISFISLNGDLLHSENLFEDFETDTSTKREEGSSSLPTNPFEIVEMIRRQNSLNDATNPSDAIDDALKSFYSLEEE